MAGLASPRVGDSIQHRGGRPVLAVSAVLLALGLTGLALAPALPIYLASWLVLGAGMGAGLYDAAFATLGRLYGQRARRAIATLTLFGGFASTVCWPLSAMMVSQFGWRGACLVYAAIQICFSLPIHLFVLPPAADPVASGAASAMPMTKLTRDERPVFAILAVVLTVGAAILSMVGMHLLSLLQARGVPLAAAVAFGTMVGPSQVGARVIEMLAGSRYHPIWTMIASTVLVTVGTWLLYLDIPLYAVAIVLYGAGNGIGSIARGTLPLALFGPERYPQLMGRLALPLLISMSIAPLIGALVFNAAGADGTLALLASLAAANVLLVAVLWRFSAKHRAREG